MTGSIAVAAAELRSGRTSCVQLAEEALDSLQRWGPHLNAWIDFSTPFALASARRLDRVIGFKPAYGRVSLRRLLGGSYNMDHIGRRPQNPTPVAGVEA